MKERFLNRKLKWISCAAVVVLVLSIACINHAEQKDKSGRTENNRAEVVLDYYIWSDEEAYVRKVVDAWNILKGREAVRLHVIPNTQLEEWLKQYDESTGADIVGLRGNANLLELQQRGLLLNLRDYLKTSELDVAAYGNMFNEITVDGGYYGLPTRSTCRALFYNKELFDKAGIPYPGQMTWAEYEELAKKLTSGSGESQIWGGYIPPWIYHFSAIQKGYYLLDDNIEPITESLELINRIYQSGTHMPFASIKDRGDECRYDFEKGNIAMVINGEWLVNMFLNDKAAGASVPEWGIAPVPVPEGVEKGTTVGMYQFAGITANCQYPEEAFAFLEFYCGKLGAQIYAGEAIIPGYCDEEIREIYEKASGTDTAKVFFEAKLVQEQPMWGGYNILLEQFKVCSEQYLEGQLSLEEAMDQFVEIREDKIK